MRRWLFLALLVAFCCAWSPQKIWRTGRKEAERREFVENLDRELPDALRRWAGREYEDHAGTINALLVAVLGGAGIKAERVRRRVWGKMRKGSKT